MIRADRRLWNRVLDNVRALPINTLFVESILCDHVDGQVFCDDERDPRAFYAVHPYGMALLWGSLEREQWHASLRAHLRERHRPVEWLQVYPDAWARIVESALDEPSLASGATKYTRVNFAFDRAEYLRARAVLNPAIERATIVATTAEMFDSIEGSVVPKQFWRDANQFIRMAGGFTAIVGGAPAATAFCSYRHGTQLEIGIETAPRHRGSGLAQLVVSALIDDCLSRGLEPVWACRLENVGSYRLATKLGFVPVRQLPYYRLPG
ncbi:MAG TPA: GNAT family N-acetyltransferase [Kofleriaceae bacterium]